MPEAGPEGVPEVPEAGPEGVPEVPEAGPALVPVDQLRLVREYIEHRYGQGHSKLSCARRLAAEGFSPESLRRRHKNRAKDYADLLDDLDDRDSRRPGRSGPPTGSCAPSSATASST